MNIKHLAGIFLLIPFACTNQKNTDTTIEQVENSLSPAIVFGDTLPKWSLEERMKETGVKGLSIAVIRDYKIVWAKGYGWADSAAGKKVTTETRFQAASISKSLNSLGVLSLVQQGKLDPEADINNYLKSWQFPYDTVSHGKKITTWNLLSHTAGLSVHGFPGYKKLNVVPGIVQILNGEDPANSDPVRSLFEPGLRFQYSGGGTSISQLLVEDITGQPYAEYMEENVLKPLGMKHSSYRQPPTDTANLAIGYYSNGQPVAGNFHIYPEQAAAGLWTTPTDLANYIIECQLALKGSSSKVLSKEMMQKRMTPYIDSAAAMGVFIHKTDSAKYFTHNGGNEAFLCTSYGSLEGGNGVVIMINGDNFAVIGELLNSVARVYDWKGFYKPEYRKIITLPVDSLDKYTGRFMLASSVVTVFRCGDGLCVQQNGMPEEGFKLLFTDATHFSIREEPGAVFTITRNESGGITGLVLQQGQTEIAMPRIE